MTIELPYSLQQGLSTMARREHREVTSLIEDAVRMYLEVTSISNLEPWQVAESQAVLARELSLKLDARR